MRIGLFAAGPGLGASGPWPDLLGRFRTAEESGFSSAWAAQLFGIDPVVLCAGAASATGSIEIGTAVLTTRPRHPIVLAQEALSLSAAAEGRFTLGLGLGHRPVLERNFGLPFDRPVRHLNEYLDVLADLLDGQRVRHQGPDIVVDTRLDIPGARPSLVVAALGPKILDVAGRRCDGTFTWMGGISYLDGFAVPRITAAAAAAGRPAPRVIAGFPVAVTDKRDSALDHAARELELYGRMPSYRATLDTGGYDSPTDICLVGTEDELADTAARIADIGVTDLVVAPMRVPEDPGSQTRSVEFFGGLARQDGS